MPITKGQFARASEAPIKQPGRFKTRLLDYLQKHADQAFSQKELAAVFDRSEQQCRQTAIALMDDGLVERREHTAKTASGGIKTTIYYRAVAVKK